MGVFYAEKPTRTKRNSYKVTAYDTMSKLDADFSGWLHANQAHCRLGCRSVPHRLGE